MDLEKTVKYCQTVEMAEGARTELESRKTGETSQVDYTKEKRNWNKDKSSISINKHVCR